MTDSDGYYTDKWNVKYQPPKVAAAAPGAASDDREAKLQDADIIEIDEEDGTLTISTETKAKAKIKSTIPKTNGKCLIQLEL
jgi:dihydroxyacid dehydratase/phosphogluconate dehydratase